MLLSGLQKAAPAALVIGVSPMVIGSAAEWIPKAAPAALVIGVSLMVIGSAAEWIPKAAPAALVIVVSLRCSSYMHKYIVFFANCCLAQLVTAVNRAADNRGKTL